MKILIIKLAKIGDVLLTTPLFSNLKAHFKDCKIHILVNYGTDGLLDSTLLDEVLILKREKNFFKKISSNLSLLFKIKKEKYDLVLGLSSHDRTAFLSLISGAKIRVGFNAFNFFTKLSYTHLTTYKDQHNIEQNLDALRILGIPIINKIVCAKRAESCKKLDNLPEKFIHCHFFSDFLFKCLDEEICAKIIDFIYNRYKITCVLTSSPNKMELQKLQNIKNLLNTQIINFTGNLSLDEVSLLNSKALAFIGVDTSIMHLSGANNTPAFGIFGPTLTSIWAIWDNCLQSSCINHKTSKHRIYTENLPCLPCGKKGCKNSGVSECLKDKLNIENLLKSLDSFLTPLV